MAAVARRLEIPMSEPKVLGTWSLDEGAIEFEALSFEDGCQVVLFDHTNEDLKEGDEVPPVAIANGLAELDALLALLQEARKKICALPKVQQGAPDFDEDEDGDGSDDDDASDDEPDAEGEEEHDA